MCNELLNVYVDLLLSIVHTIAIPNILGIIMDCDMPHYLTEFLLKLLAKKVFSESGSISLVKEQSTYVFFRNLLDEVEGNCLYVHCACTPGNSL